MPRMRRKRSLARHQLMAARPARELFRSPLVALQFEAVEAASRVEEDPIPVRKQASALGADTPIEHVVDDLGSGLDSARLHHGAVRELDLVMKLEELPSRLGVQGDHGSLAVLIPDEHDSIADGERAEGLPGA